MRTCNVQNCSLKHYAKGYCKAHYMRVRTRGTTEPYEGRGETHHAYKHFIKTDTGYIAIRRPNITRELVKL